MRLLLSKVDSPNSSPLPLVLKKRAVPPFAEAKYARYFWRFEDEPTSPYQYLGQQTVGFPFSVPFDPQGREIRISMIGVSQTGALSVADPRKGVQTTFTPPSLLGLILTDGGDVLTDNGEILTDG